MKQYRNIVTVLVMCILIFGLSLAFLLSPSRDYTYSERRALAQKPEISAQTLKNGRFMSDFETFTLDQFPLRDVFRSVKALTASYVFGRSDNNGFYRYKGQIGKMEYPLNQTRLEKNIAVIREVMDRYLQDTDCSLYLSLIPDKNYFLAEESGHLAMDYEAMMGDVVRALPEASYIDISDLMEMEDFYATDQHWRQERIVDIAETLYEAMGGEFSGNFCMEEVKTPFTGTYVGQAALPTELDTIRYLTNDTLENCHVISYSTGSPRESSIYTLEKAEGKDAYELFLGGSDPLIIIENPSGRTGKELVVFRDSFGSSLIPLMIQDYETVTIVDLRYFRLIMLGQFVEFKDQDVLFLYSTLILNNNISQ